MKENDKKDLKKMYPADRGRIRSLPRAKPPRGLPLARSKRVRLLLALTLAVTSVLTGSLIAFPRSVTLGNVTITYQNAAYLGGRTNFYYRVQSDPQGQYWILEMESCISQTDVVLGSGITWVETPIRGVKVTITSTDQFPIVMLYGDWTSKVGLVDVGAADYLGVFRSQVDAIEGPVCTAPSITLTITAGSTVTLGPVARPDFDYSGTTTYSISSNGSWNLKITALTVTQNPGTDNAAVIAVMNHHTVGEEIDSGTAGDYTGREITWTVNIPLADFVNPSKFPVGGPYQLQYTLTAYTPPG